MKDATNIEISLLKKSKGHQELQDVEETQENNNININHNSPFINYLSSYSPPNKYVQKIPFWKKIFLIDNFPTLRKMNNTNDPFEIKDVPQPDKHFNVEAKVISLDYYWTQELAKKEPSFMRAFCKAFSKEIMQSIFFCFINLTGKICYSLFLGNITTIITSHLQEEEINSKELLQSAIILSILILITLLASVWEWFSSFKNSGKAKLAIIGLLYKKLISISLTSLQHFKIGKVINLIANDLNDIDVGATFVPTMVICPFIIILGTIIMWSYFGSSCLIGLISAILCLLIQVCLSNMTENPRNENKHLTDDRIKYTNEIIENIRLVKMYAWEKIFRSNIEKLRTKEVETFLKMIKLEVIGRTLSITSAFLAILLICMYYVSHGGVLSPDKIYASMIILSFISLVGLLFFYLGRIFVVNLGLILKRVENVMTIEDIITAEETKTQKDLTSNMPVSRGMVTFHSFNASWGTNSQNLCLKDINVTLEPGTLTTIIGKIGSGKTTLLLSLLKELPFTSGSLIFTGKVAYVEQEPVIFSGTIRNNILFGKEYDEKLYKEVVKVCNLDKDLIHFSHGDLSLIGEKGVNLSGGQKARVSLARAIYSESDIYLLDDPFSAVDIKVARDMFEKGLRGELMRGKTILLVTHHLNFARKSDYVLVMEKGQIEAQGKFHELEHFKLDLFQSIVQNESRKESMISDIDDGKEIEKKELLRKTSHKKEELIAEESTLVSWETYKSYSGVIGTSRYFIILTFLFIFNQILVIYYTRFLGHWALQHSEFVHLNPDARHTKFDHSFYIITAWVIFALLYVVYYVKRIMFSNFLLDTNSELHKRMLNTLTRAKVLFFDTTPIGRILNRFSADVGILDKPNITSAYDLFDGLLYSISLLITVCALQPVLFISSGLIIYILYKIQKYFRKPMVQAKKIELISRSPIYSMVSSTLNGLTTIRVYNNGGKFLRSFMELLYDNSKAYLFLMKTTRLMGLILDLGISGIMIIGIMGLSALVLYYHFDPSLIGLSLLFLLQIGEETSYCIRQTLAVDINMQSAQRMIEYCQLESEAPEETPNDKNIIGANNQVKWPVNGEIVFDNVYLRYRPELNYALNGLTFSVPGGTKVACVGRTGAGKSSLIQALFRLVEIEKNPLSTNGSIKIDGIDINTIGLTLLRQRISIIPQTPVVFAGTIRHNLDPFRQSTDEELLSVLQEVSLKQHILSLENQLDTDMTSSASIFSVGQKQLICLARAILTKSKVLILDEATANVDLETDEFIQEKIREKFADCTVLTIAHRLVTIANYDKVIVMDKGKMVEFDSPYKLLVENVGDEKITKNNGIFADMVKNTGVTISKKIFQMASDNFFGRKYVESRVYDPLE